MSDFITNADHYRGATLDAELAKQDQCSSCERCRLSATYNGYRDQPFAISSKSCFQRFLAAPYGMPLDIGVPWTMPAPIRDPNPL